MKVLLKDKSFKRLLARLFFALGVSASRVANILGISFAVARDWQLLEQLSLTRSENSDLKKARNRAIGLFNQGWGYKKTARELGVNLYTVRYWLRVWKRKEVAYV